MSILQRPPTGGNLGPIDVRTQVPSRPEKWVKTPESLLFERPDLTTTEVLCIAALLSHDWYGTGCHPCNETLIKACRLKDKGSMSRLLSGLQRKGYLRVELVESTPANRTGRIIHLTLPTTAATGDGPRLHVDSTPLFDANRRYDSGVQGGAAPMRGGAPRQCEGGRRASATRIDSERQDKNVNVGKTSTWLRPGGEESGTPMTAVVSQAEPAQTSAVPIEPTAEVAVIAVGDGPPAAEKSPHEPAAELVARLLARGIRVELDPSAGPDKARWVPEPGADPIRPEEKAELVKLKPQILAFLKGRTDPSPSPRAEPDASTIEDKIRRLRFGEREKAQELAAEVAKLFAVRWKDPGSIGGFRKNLARIAAGEIPVKGAITAYRKASKCGPDAIPGAIWNYWINQATGGTP